MMKFEVRYVLAFAMTTAVGFIGGYIFHAVYGEARSAAAEAVFSAQETQRVLQAYEPINLNFIMYRQLEAARTPADVAALRDKHRDSALRSIESFERNVEKLQLPNDKRLAEPFLQEARRIRSQLGK